MKMKKFYALALGCALFAPSIASAETGCRTGSGAINMGKSVGKSSEGIRISSDRMELD